MRKLSIKNIIEFRGKSSKSKQKFASNLKINIEKDNIEGGGDYWISSLSAIANSYKSNDLQFINDKRYELEEKFEITKYKRTKIMYQRNIDILYNYEDFNFKQWRPSNKIIFIKKNKTNSVITIRGFQVKVNPHFVFAFQENNIEAIGAIWFIAKLEGLKKGELGMFADILYRYLNNNFSSDYVLNPQFCIAVDIYNNVDVNYSQIQKAEIPALLNITIDEIKKLI